MSPVNTTQTRMTELSEVCSLEPDGKERDRWQKWQEKKGRKRTGWKTGWFGVPLAFCIKLGTQTWTQTTHTHTQIQPHINAEVFSPAAGSDPTLTWYVWHHGVRPSRPANFLLLWWSCCVAPETAASSIPLSLPAPSSSSSSVVVGADVVWWQGWPVMQRGPLTSLNYLIGVLLLGTQQAYYFYY